MAGACGPQETRGARSSASVKEDPEMDSSSADSEPESDEAVALGSVVVVYTNNASLRVH